MAELEYQILTFDYKDRIGSFSFSTTKVVNGNSFNNTYIAELNLRESTNFVFGDIDE